MFKRIRKGLRERIGQRVAQWAGDHDAGAPGAEERLSFAAELPVGQNQPLLRIQLQMVNEPQADGERLRLRAHIQTNFASALRPALEQAAAAERPALAAGTGTALSLGQRSAAALGGALQRAAQRALEIPAVRALSEPLLQLDLNTFVEIQASTASLADGSHHLLPQADKLRALGIVPKRSTGAPVAETWGGQAADGFAQVSVLQIDKRHLPPRLAELLGDKPFSLAAAIVNTAEQK
ncbi:MAG TPA: hypothetical protein VGE51_15805 [Fontimonas sp.]